MNIKIAFGVVATILAIGLSGCVGHHMHGASGLSAEQGQNWKDAAAQYKACNKTWREQKLSDVPQWNQLVSGHNDPMYLQKMTSKVPLSNALKESLVKYRPQQLACRKLLFDSLGDSNPAVKMMYQKNFNALDDSIVKILDGKIKTVGELNQAYVAYNNDVIERKARLMAHSSHN